MNEVEEVKARLDIVDVVGGYVQLKRTGSSFKGLSPFKTEKTPSFVVSPEKNIWHDFSSGKGGDVISFVMEMEGLSFPEALEMLAKKAGVKLKPRRGQDGVAANSKNRLYDSNAKAMAYYHLALSKNQAAKEYFTKARGLSAEIIKKFKLGYSPDSWDSLTNYLKSLGFTDDEMVAAGLCAKGRDTRGAYDLFRGRVMFPVFDSQNRPIGFSARILKEAKAAKYINTPQTPIYNKSLAIYGLSQAKEKIRELDRVVVVEGNMDVLALHNAGFENCVACSGTALTELQIRQLSRLTKNITLCFDDDEAGVNASLRAISLAGNFDVRIDVMSLVGAKDPDELLKKGPKAWTQALDKAQYLPDFIIAYAKGKFDLGSAYGKKQFGKFVAPMLRNLSDEIESKHYTKKIAQLLDVDEMSIQKLTQQPADSPTPTSVDTPTQTEQIQKQRRLTTKERQEQELIELCLAFPVTLPALIDLKLAESSELHKNIFRHLKKYDGKNFGKLVEELPKEANYVKILALRGEQQYADLSAHDIRLEAFTQVARIQASNRQDVKKSLARQIAEAEEAGDTKKSKELLIQYQELLNEE